MSAAAVLLEHDLGPVDAIPLGEGREYTVAGVRLAVFRLRTGGLAATAAACPHRGGPLADGITGMDAVVCPLHGRRYSLTAGRDGGGGEPVACHPVRVGPGERIVVSLPDGGRG